MATSRRTKKKSTTKKSRSRKTTRKRAKKPAGNDNPPAAEQSPAEEPAKPEAQAEERREQAAATATAVEEAPAGESTGPMDVLFGDGQPAEAAQLDEDAHAEWKPNLYELHDLVQQLGETVQQQWREMQEATRSLDELRSHSPRRSDVMEGRTYLSQDMRALVEPLQQETEKLGRRMQWCFGMLLGVALVAVPALLKVLFA